MRRYVGPHLLGLVGYGLLRDYEVVIDYAHRRVACYSLQTKRPAPRPFRRQDSLAFTLVRGGPLVTGYLGQVPVRLLLDTGAATNQLDAAFCRTLPARDQPTLLGTEPITGSDGHQQLAQRGRLSTLVLGATTWQGLPVMLIALARPASGRPLG